MADDDELGDVHIARIAETLRQMPAVDPSAIARVLVATAAAERDDARRARRRFNLISRIAVAAAGIAFFMFLMQRSTSGDAPQSASPAGPPLADAPRGGAAGAALAANRTDAALVPVQLVMRAPSARRMFVVGDFTGWDDARVPMVRDPASGLWSATVTVRPGRHVYAFVADDSVWMRDPSAPVAVDADFGRPGSLLLVGRP